MSSCSVGKYSKETSLQAPHCRPCYDPCFYCTGEGIYKCADDTYTSPDGSYCQQCVPGNECDPSWPLNALTAHSTMGSSLNALPAWRVPIKERPYPHFASYMTPGSIQMQMSLRAVLNRQGRPMLVARKQCQSTLNAKHQVPADFVPEDTDAEAVVFSVVYTAEIQQLE